MVRKYIIGTRSRHGKIVSIVMDEEAKGPDDKGMWLIKGTYVTEESGKEQFTARVTPRGEVTILTPTSTDSSAKHPSRASRR